MINTFRKLCALLDRREKRNGALLLAIMLVQGFVEMAGVASIVPFMTVVANPKVIHSNSYLAAIYDGLGFTSQTSFLLFLGIGSLLVILARIGVTGLTTYATMRYAQMRSFALSIRLLENYIMQPYEWFLNRHSAGMVKAVLSEVDEVVKDSLMPAFALVSQLIIVTCLILLVVIAEPRVALLTLLIVGTVYGLIYWTLRNYLRELGRGRLTANRQRFQIANELLGGIKEVKIRGLEQPYLRRAVPSALYKLRASVRAPQGAIRRSKSNAAALS
jgi:ABC-type bacteriocin/lantibiotic exporter with double-glycine peptidase domain